MSKPRDGRYGVWSGCPEGSPEDTTRCQEQVFPSGRGAMHRQCDRKWKVTSKDGSRWCKQHDPQAIKAKREAWERKFQADQEANRLRWARKAKAEQIVAAALASTEALPEPLATLVKQYRKLREPSEGAKE